MRDFFESSPSSNSASSEPTQTAEFEVMRQRLLDCLDSFSRYCKMRTLFQKEMYGWLLVCPACSAPFTIQRLCEMMCEPQRHYRCSEKFMRGIEKVGKSGKVDVLCFSTVCTVQILLCSVLHTRTGTQEISTNSQFSPYHDEPHTTAVSVTQLDSCTLSLGVCHPSIDNNTIVHYHCTSFALDDWQIIGFHHHYWNLHKCMSHVLWMWLCVCV